MSASLLTTAEAAARLGIDASGVRRFILRGELAAEKRGGTHLIPAAALDAFMADRRPVGRPPVADTRVRLDPARRHAAALERMRCVIAAWAGLLARLPADEDEGRDLVTALVSEKRAEYGRLERMFARMDEPQSKLRAESI